MQYALYNTIMTYFHMFLNSLISLRVNSIYMNKCHKFRSLSFKLLHVFCSISHYKLLKFFITLFCLCLLLLMKFTKN